MAGRRARSDSPARIFLLQAVRSFADPNLECPSPTGVVGWEDAAVTDGVLSLVIHVLKRHGHPVPERWRHYAPAVAARQMRSMHDLDVVGRALDEADVPWMLLKGPVLASVVYRTPGVRDSVDLDLYVPSTHFRRSLEVMGGLGARVMGVDWMHSAWRQGSECPVDLRHGTTLDLHWHLINRPMIRRSYDWSMAALTSRSVRREVDGVAVWTPDDLDFVLHVLLHACLDGCARLRCIIDAEQCVAWLAASGHTPGDLAARAREHGLTVPARLTLGSAAQHLDPGLLPWARAMGGGTAWTRAAARLDRRLPPGPIASPLTRRMNRHTTPQTTTSLLAVLEREIEQLRSRLSGAADGNMPVGFTRDGDAAFARWLEFTERQPIR